VADDHYVTRKQRREYEDWREATDLTEEERVVGLPVVPGVDQAAAPPRPQRKDRPELYGELPTLQERLAHIRDPDEAARILGPRRLASYALVAAMFAAAFAALTVYSIAEIALGRTYFLGMLPGSIFVAAFAGVIAYGLWYRIATGREWPRAAGIDRVAGILNNTYVLPRRR
jgi:hypothetical protein